MKNMRKMIWSWAGLINHLKDDRWTSYHVSLLGDNTTRKGKNGDQPSDG